MDLGGKMWAGRNQENYILNKNKRWVHLNTKSILKLFRWVAGTILRNLHYFRSELNEIFPSFPRVSLTDTAVWVSARPSLLCTKAGQNRVGRKAAVEARKVWMKSVIRS